MIHHFARALAVREQARSRASSLQGSPSGLSIADNAVAAPSAIALRAKPPTMPRGLRMRRDPLDARRTVITGRFAEVCAALDRMVAELEPA